MRMKAIKMTRIKRKWKRDEDYGDKRQKEP